jgi:Flp pilus assembly protein TadD
VRFVDRSVETAAPDDLEAQIAWRTVQAKLLATAGRLENAETLARHAVSLAERTDWSNDHAAACVALGEVLHKQGRPEQAQAVMRKALALYEARKHCCRRGNARPEGTAAGTSVGVDDASG